MTIPANLFVDTPEMQDVSLHRLSNDSDVWPEEIIQHVKEKVPGSDTIQLMVKFMKKDDENGTATGSVIASSPKKKVLIPIIIKDFKLYPLDVMISSGKLLPLTVNYFAKAFSDDAEVFQDLEQFPTFSGLGRFEDANMWDAIYPPALGRYAYASSLEFPMMEVASDYIDGKAFLHKLAEDHGSVARFYANGYRDVLLKIGELQPVNSNEFSDGKERLLDKNILTLRREGPDKYNILATDCNVFHPAMTAMPRKDMVDFLYEVSDQAEDDINAVDQNGEKTIVPFDHGDVMLAKPERNIAETANEFDHYAVKNYKTGVEVEGIVIPRVINFEQEPQNLKIFIGKTMATIQPEICGMRIQNSDFRIEGAPLRIGQTGCFVYQPDDSHGLATIPVTLESVWQDGCVLAAKVRDLKGNRFKLRFNPQMKLQRIAEMGDNCYCMPTEFKWQPMQGFEPVSSTPEEYAIKTAARVPTNKSTIVDLGSGSYGIKGSIEKLANSVGWQRTGLSRGQAEFLAASMGCGNKDLGKLFKTAAVKGHADFYVHKLPMTGEEKIAAEAPRRQKLEKLASLLRKDCIKEASYMDNAQTVDALLSLNFISPDNISKYVSKVPVLKAAASAMAGCLLASRLGMQEIPEQATAAGMYKLVETIEGLEKLKAIQEHGD